MYFLHVQLHLTTTKDKFLGPQWFIVAKGRHPYRKTSGPLGWRLSPDLEKHMIRETGGVVHGYSNMNVQGALFRQQGEGTKLYEYMSLV